MSATTAKEIDVYICPTPGCPSYFGHDGMQNLGGYYTGPKVDDKAALKETTGSPYRHTRAACPVCRAGGKEVERVRVRVRVDVPTSGPRTPALPIY